MILNHDQNNVQYLYINHNLLLYIILSQCPKEGIWIDKQIGQAHMLIVVKLV